MDSPASGPNSSWTGGGKGLRRQLHKGAAARLFREALVIDAVGQRLRVRYGQEHEPRLPAPEEVRHDSGAEAALGEDGGGLHGLAEVDPVRRQAVQQGVDLPPVALRAALGAEGDYGMLPQGGKLDLPRPGQGVAGIHKGHQTGLASSR